MPNARTKNNVLYVDPGGDPASPGLHGQVSSGGVVECLGVVVSTQVSGWRQALITKGVAT